MIIPLKTEKKGSTWANRVIFTLGTCVSLLFLKDIYYSKRLFALAGIHLLGFSTLLFAVLFRKLCVLSAPLIPRFLYIPKWRERTIFIFAIGSFLFLFRYVSFKQPGEFFFRSAFTHYEKEKPLNFEQHFDSQQLYNQIHMSPDHQKSFIDKYGKKAHPGRVCGYFFGMQKTSCAFLTLPQKAENQSISKNLTFFIIQDIYHFKNSQLEKRFIPEGSAAHIIAYPRSLIFNTKTQEKVAMENDGFALYIGEKFAEVYHWKDNRIIKTPIL